MKTEKATVVELRWRPSDLCLIQGVKGNYVPKGVYGGSNGSFIAPLNKSELNLILVGESEHIYKFDISSLVRKVFDKKRISKQLRAKVEDYLMGMEFTIEDNKIKDLESILRNI